MALISKHNSEMQDASLPNLMTTVPSSYPRAAWTMIIKTIQWFKFPHNQKQLIPSVQKLPTVAATVLDPFRTEIDQTRSRK